MLKSLQINGQNPAVTTRNESFKVFPDCNGFRGVRGLSNLNLNLYLNLP